MKNNELLNLVLEQSRFKYPADLIHLFVGGSRQHGAILPGKSDLDIFGIYCESPERSGLGFANETNYTMQTSGNHTKNTAQDSDFSFKTLHEWAKLAANGNPTQLAVLFTQDEICEPDLIDGIWFTHILANKNLFVANHGRSFLGYGQAQLKRMQGLKGQGTHGTRPDEFGIGFDSKAAMHMIRMMQEGLEYVKTGQLTYPRPEVSLLLDIRNGLLTKNAVEREYLRLEEELLFETSACKLPNRVDYNKLNKLISSAYIQHWKTNKLL